MELRFEAGTKAGEQGEEAGASGRRHEQDRHLKQSRVSSEKIQAGEGAFTFRGQRGRAGQIGESGGRRRDEREGNLLVRVLLGCDRRVVAFPAVCPLLLRFVEPAPVGFEMWEVNFK